MSVKQIQKRYFRTMIGSSLGYVGALLGVTYALDFFEEPFALRIALALVPCVFVVMMLRTIWRYMWQVDEAQRHFIMKSSVAALFVILMISGVWGLVELLVEGVPALPVFWIFPIYFFAFGLAGCFGPGRGMGIK